MASASRWSQARSCQQRDIDHLRRSARRGHLLGRLPGELIEYESNGLLRTRCSSSPRMRAVRRSANGTAARSTRRRSGAAARDGVIRPGLVLNAPVQSYDLMPTILAYAGLEAPARSGRQLRPLLDSTGGGRPRDLRELDAVPTRHWAAWIAPQPTCADPRGVDPPPSAGATTSSRCRAPHEGENCWAARATGRLRRQLLDCSACLIIQEHRLAEHVTGRY
jgi:hypothetical protein